MKMKLKILLFLSSFFCMAASAQFVPQSMGGNVGVKSTVRGAFKPDSGLVILSMPDTAILVRT
jgi:hypothetical protein